MKKFDPSLYFITDSTGFTEEEFLFCVEQALKGGATLLQLREKNNAVVMPYVLESYGKSVYKKLHRLGIAAGVATEEDTPMAGAIKFINAIKALNASMNIPEKMPGIQKGDIPSLAKHAAKEANPLYPVPKLMTKKELEQFYYQVADWS